MFSVAKDNALMNTFKTINFLCTETNTLIHFCNYSEHLSTKFSKDNENIPSVVFFSLSKSPELLLLVHTEATFPEVTRNAGTNDIQVQTIGPVLQS